MQGRRPGVFRPLPPPHRLTPFLSLSSPQVIKHSLFNCKLTAGGAAPGGTAAAGAGAPVPMET